MPVLTRPAFAKGSANEITLNKADLALEVSDLYFGDPANWKQVVLFYETSTGKQRKALIYDASQANPAANFDISERARDQWDIKKVAIYDFDGGSLTINRGDLTVAEFDILFDVVPPTFFTRTFNTPLELYEEGSFSVDHIVIGPAGSVQYVLADYFDVPLPSPPFPFGAFSYRVEIDYYDATSNAALAEFEVASSNGNFKLANIDVAANPSGTLMIDPQVYGSSFGYEDFYIVNLSNNSSMKISEIRFYQV